MNYTIKSILLTLFVLMPFNAYAVSFTADAVQHRGTEVSHAKMFWNDGSVRFEYVDQGIPMVQIFDNNNSKVIWLDAAKKVYIERELTDQQAVPVMAGTEKKYNPCDDFPGAECTRLKSAELNDRQTDKWLITFKVDSRDLHVFQWIDKKHQILVRQENPDGSVLDVKILDDQEINGRQVRRVDMNAIDPDGNSVRATQWYDPELDIVVRQQADDGAIDELRNIRLETVSAEMFAVPEGYRTVDSQLTDVNTETSITFGTANK
jgi:hypothetical protein